MGCCVSSGKSINSTHKFDRNSSAAVKKFAPATNNESRGPPSVTEEETVKEVLTETPALKPPPSPPAKICSPEGNEAQKPIGDKVENQGNEIPINGISQQASEFHEISKSNEFLTTTNFIDITDGGGGEVHQKALKSSPVKFPKTQLIARDVGSPNKTLNRRSEPSPVRRNRAVGSAGIVQNRDASPVTARRELRAVHHRRYPDENTGKRFRSPATARPDGGGSRSALGRTPSMRMSGRSSPLMAAMTTAPASSKKTVEENSITDENRNTQIESLENPLVSLECFIFL